MEDLRSKSRREGHVCIDSVWYAPPAHFAYLRKSREGCGALECTLLGQYSVSITRNASTVALSYYSPDSILHTVYAHYDPESCTCRLRTSCTVAWRTHTHTHTVS